MEDYTTISRSSYTDVLLPTVDHSSDFATDAKAQHDLLALLFEKLAIEHRTSNHQLFLELDPEVRARLVHRPSLLLPAHPALQVRIYVTHARINQHANSARACWLRPRSAPRSPTSVCR